MDQLIGNWSSKTIWLRLKQLPLEELYLPCITIIIMVWCLNNLPRSAIFKELRAKTSLQAIKDWVPMGSHLGFHPLLCLLLDLLTKTQWMVVGPLRLMYKIYLEPILTNKLKEITRPSLGSSIMILALSSLKCRSIKEPSIKVAAHSSCLLNRVQVKNKAWLKKDHL